MKVANIIGITREIPELVEAQIAQMAKQIPYLYFIIFASSTTLAFTYYSVAPDWLTIYPLIPLALLSIHRAIYWIRQVGKRFDLETGVQNIKKIFFAGMLLSAVISIWGAALYSYGNDLQKVHVAYFLSIGVLGCVFSVMQHPATAYASLLIVGGVSILLLGVSGNIVFIAIAANLALILPMIIRIIDTYSLALSSQIAVRRELIVLNDRVLMASRAKSEFLASMSHEIRTPLNGILGMAQVLDREELSADQREMVTTILDSGRALSAILNDVLDVSKIEAGKLVISAVDDDLRAVLTGIHRLFVPTARQKGLTLELDIDPAVPDRLHLDPVRVRQCVTNLVSNAIKFTEHGSVRIRASADGEPARGYTIRIQISDTGIGIGHPEREKLFQPFTQADSSTTRRFGGTGLGLAITKRLANLMGGDVLLESEVGKGSAFTLVFHAKAAAGRSADALLEQPSPKGR
jgi:signal transduction histidine kinase